jgi:hypothetical protein
LFDGLYSAKQLPLTLVEVPINRYTVENALAPAVLEYVATNAADDPIPAAGDTPTTLAIPAPGSSVTVNGCPAIVKIPDRTGPVFGATENDTLAPLFIVTDIQLTLLPATGKQPGLDAFTIAIPVPPLAANDCGLTDDVEKLQTTAESRSTMPSYCPAKSFWAPGEPGPRLGVEVIPASSMAPSGANLALYARSSPIPPQSVEYTR